jgi:disulfide bond formation protein DsbB
MTTTTPPATGRTRPDREPSGPTAWGRTALSATGPHRREWGQAPDDPALYRARQRARSPNQPVSHETVQLFYGLLALLAWVFIGVLAVVRLAALVSDGALDGWERVSDAIAPNALGLAWFVAFLATAGSLYFSEMAGYVPCTLCWYQRIAMYPLVVILAIGAARRETAAAVYATALAVIGALIALYHTVLEWVPSLDAGACSVSAPCTYVWFRIFGLISLPLLALTAFALIIVLLTIRIRHPDHRSDP